MGEVDLLRDGAEGRSERFGVPWLESQAELPFPTMEFTEVGHCTLFSLVTNGDPPGDERIR